MMMFEIGIMTVKFFGYLAIDPFLAGDSFLFV